MPEPEPAAPGDVRVASVADAPACARVMRESRAVAMPWLPVLHTPEEDRAYLESVLTRLPAWVATQGDRVVGFAVLDPEAGTLEHLYLAPEVQRRGIGGALLTAVRSAAEGPLELWVFAGNAGARAFYARHGGRELFATDGRDNEERTPDVRVRLPAVTG